MEEKELSLECARGNADARKILYERYSEHLYGVCLRYSGAGMKLWICSMMPL